VSDLHQAIVTILLGAGVAVELLGVLGLVVMRDAFDRLHYVGLVTYGALLVAISILVREGFSLIGDKALLTGALLIAIGPVLVHATARSFRIREHGDWRKGIEDHVEGRPR
jgi:multicomponent Na+:H+ antiporter subunit G